MREENLELEEKVVEEGSSEEIVEETEVVEKREIVEEGKIVEKKETVEEKEDFWKEFCREEDGVGVVEIILILVILIGLVLIFKENISEIVESAFKQINGDAKSIID